MAGLATAAPARAADETTIFGLSQTRPMPTDRTLRNLVAQDRRRVCGGQPVRSATTLPQALAHTERLVSRRAVARLRRSPAAKTARRASGLAVGAIADGRQTAAVAALLVAHERAPRNAAHLANLGGLVTTLGEPRDGLAILDAASRLRMPRGAPMGIARGAALQNNRGQALVLLHRYAEAVRVLKAAARREPEMTEAQRNLAAAYACLGQPTKAIAALRKCLVRSTTPTTPPRPGQRRPVVEVLDMSQGMQSPLPDLNLPGSASAMDASVDFYRELSVRAGKYMDQLDSRYDGGVLLEYGAVEERARRMESPRVRQRLRDILELALIGPIPDGLAGFNELDAEILDLREEPGCGDHGAWLQLMARMTQLLAEGNRLHYAYLTALAANVDDPAINEWLNRAAEYYRASKWDYLAREAHDWSVQMSAADCDPQGNSPSSGGGGEITGGEGSGRCNIKSAPTLSLGPVDISVDCEKIEVEVSGGLLSPFFQSSYNFRKGEMTVYAGSKFGLKHDAAPLGSADAKTGLYLTAGREGFRDAGIRVSVGGTGHIGPLSTAKSESIDFTFVGAPPGPP